MNSLYGVRLTNEVVNAGQLRYVVQASAGGTADQGDLTAQYRVTRYLNKSTGKELPIILDRYCPQGHLVFLPLSVPFPVPEIANAVEIETNQEYWGVGFAITDSNFKFANYVDETLKVYFLGGLGVLRGIYPSSREYVAAQSMRLVATSSTTANTRPASAAMRRSGCRLITLVASSVAETTLNSTHEPTKANEVSAWRCTRKALTSATGSRRPTLSALRPSRWRTARTVAPSQAAMPTKAPVAVKR
jgi:hypothetical protein